MTNDDTAQVTAGQLYEQLQTLIRDSEELLKATASYADDRLQDVRARAQSSLHSARERLAGARDEALERTRGLLEQGEDYVRDNPWPAIGIAAAVGLLAGVLIARR
jgi:ElaB/YqjD/DUF883 family membrane-anchored ribosome-binding protein